MDAWMGAYMDGCMDGCIGGCIGGCMGGSLDDQLKPPADPIANAVDGGASADFHALRGALLQQGAPGEQSGGYDGSCVLVCAAIECEMCCAVWCVLLNDAGMVWGVVWELLLRRSDVSNLLLQRLSKLGDLDVKLNSLDKQTLHQVLFLPSFSLLPLLHPFLSSSILLFPPFPPSFSLLFPLHPSLSSFSSIILSPFSTTLPHHHATLPHHHATLPHHHATPPHHS